MDLLHLSAIEIHQAFMQKKISALQIVDFFLERIDRLDPEIRAFLQVYHETSREKAKQLDIKLQQGKSLGKLAGIPVALKDNIHLKGSVTSCGSKFLENYYAPFDATVTRLLKQEDAIIIGKTNLDEFAMGSSNENSAFFPSHNPWNLEHCPGGSSGGSAAAVAARMVPIAFGSDTGGSIRQPAAFCGVVGFKPTYGRVSRYGLVAFGSSLDQIGPITTNCKDNGYIMEVMGQHCLHDATSTQKPSEEYLTVFKDRLDGIKIGIPSKFLEKHTPKNIDTFNEAVEKCKSLGAEVVDIDLSILEASIGVYYVLATAEASTNLARFDGIRYGKRVPKEDLQDLYFESRKEGFGSEVKRRILLGTYVLSSGYQDAYYRKAQKIRTLIIQDFAKAHEKCNVIFMPTTSVTAFKLNSIHDPLEMYLQDIYTIGSNLAGLPAISIPIGKDSQELPIGMQMIGKQFEDVHVLQIAHSLEESIRFYQNVPALCKGKKG